MNWYLAKLIYQIICGDGQHQPQFDEQLRLISATDEKEALLKAQQMGLLEEDSFLNERRNLVKWKFIDVCELFRISQLLDGAELYSRVYEMDDAKQYIEWVRHKADYIQGDNILRSLQLI
jgi:hypothetical protein